MADPKYRPLDPSITPRFADVATFMRAKRVEMNEEIDIGLVGVPFDIGVNYRSGPREAPAFVRQYSRLIRMVHPTSGVAPFDLVNVADLGDAPVNPLDFAQSKRFSPS